MFTTIFIVGIIGILAGGIVNVLADDLPPKRKPDGEYSGYGKPTFPKYPDGTARPVSAWLGVSAFLLGKRTSPDGAKLSWRHPITELLTATLMILTIVQTDGRSDVSSLQLVFWLIYMAIFVLITVIDIEHKLILFIVIIPAAVLAILDAILTPSNAQPELRDALIGGAFGFGVFFIMYLGGVLFTYIKKIRTVAFGYGDVMMATLSGLILGWRPLIFAMFITVFLGAFGAILYLVIQSLTRGKYRTFTALPYGPYIVAGTIIMLLFNEVIPILLGWA